MARPTSAHKFAGWETRLNELIPRSAAGFFTRVNQADPAEDVNVFHHPEAAQVQPGNMRLLFRR